MYTYMYIVVVFVKEFKQQQHQRVNLCLVLCPPARLMSYLNKPSCPLLLQFYKEQ